MVAEAPPLPIAAPPVIAPAPIPAAPAPSQVAPAPAPAIGSIVSIPAGRGTVVSTNSYYFGNSVVTGITVDMIDTYPVAVNFEFTAIASNTDSGTSGATMDYAANQWATTSYPDSSITSKSLYLTAKTTIKNWVYANSWETGTTFVTAQWSTANVNTKRWRMIGGTWGGGANWAVEDYPLSKVDQFRKKLRENMTPEIVTKNRDLWGIALSEQEIRARTLLLELVGDAAFRRYLRRGFIMVEGRSGTLYKISGGNTMIVSYVKNIHGRFEACEKFCVQFQEYNLPFTDGVIMRKLLVESDEFQLRKVANVWEINKVDKAQPLIAAAG